MKGFSVLKEKMLKFFGVVSTSFWAMGIVIFLFENDQEDDRLRNIMMSVTFMIFGICMIISANRKTKLRNLAEVYQMCLADKPEALLSDIAHTLNIPTSQVVRELKELIRKDYLENIYVDMSEGRVKILGRKGSKLQTENEYIYITCKNCGGVNQVAANNDYFACSFCDAEIVNNRK